MRLIEDNRFIVGNDARREGTLAQRQVGKEQVVVDHHQGSLTRPVAHPGDVAGVVVLALGADACVGTAVHLGPQRGALGNAFKLGAVAGFRPLLPGAQDVELGPVLAAAGGGALHEGVVAPQAKVVGQPLHARGVDRLAERALQQGQVVVHDLVLERTRAGRHDDLAPAGQRRDQIGERFAGPGARFRE